MIFYVISYDITDDSSGTSRSLLAEIKAAYVTQIDIIPKAIGPMDQRTKRPSLPLVCKILDDSILTKMIGTRNDVSAEGQDHRSQKAERNEGQKEPHPGKYLFSRWYLFRFELLGATSCRYLQPFRRVHRNMLCNMHAITEKGYRLLETDITVERI